MVASSTSNKSQSGEVKGWVYLTKACGRSLCGRSADSMRSGGQRPVKKRPGEGNSGSATVSTSTNIRHNRASERHEMRTQAYPCPTNSCCHCICQSPTTCRILSWWISPVELFFFPWGIFKGRRWRLTVIIHSKQEGRQVSELSFAETAWCTEVCLLF